MGWRWARPCSQIGKSEESEKKVRRPGHRRCPVEFVGAKGHGGAGAGLWTTQRPHTGRRIDQMWAHPEAAEAQ